MNELTLVFVHLGTAPPKYLMDNLRRNSKLFPGAEQVLVHSGQIRKLPSALRGIVKLHKYDPSRLEGMRVAAPSLAHDRTFWSGYWQHTFERLFAFGEYLATRPNRSMLHVESDVVLFPNFPIAQVAQLNTVAWPRVSPTMDVASVVFAPTAGSFLSVLAELRLAAMANPKVTDMGALALVEKGPAGLASHFSSVPRADSIARNTRGGSLLSDEFPDGIFDGLTLGYWFTGRDPKNSWGVAHRYLVPLDSDLDYSSYEFAVTSEGQLTLAVRQADKTSVTDVYCLHVHSKRAGYFRHANQSFLVREAQLVNARKSAWWFDFSKLLFHLRTHWTDLLSAATSIEKWKKLLTALKR